MSETDTGTKESAAAFGYDFMQVPYKHCLLCGTAIGVEPYVEDCAFQRFGQMFVLHLRCFGGLPDAEQRRMTKLRNKRLMLYWKESKANETRRC